MITYLFIWRGKLACELMVVNYGRTVFDRVLIFRPHNVYGPDMGWEHVLPQFVERAVKGSLRLRLAPSAFRFRVTVPRRALSCISTISLAV